MGVSLAIRGNDEGVEPHGTGVLAVARHAGESDVAGHRATGRDVERNLREIEVGVENLEDDVTAGDADELKPTEIVGVDGLGCALDGDPGVVEILAGHHVLDPTVDGAGRGGAFGRVCRRVGGDGEGQPGAKHGQRGFHLHGLGGADSFWFRRLRLRSRGTDPLDHVGIAFLIQHHPQRCADDQSFKGLADREAALHGIGRHTAHVFDQIDELSPGLIGKRLQRHLGIRRRNGERSSCHLRTMEVGRRQREKQDQRERQAQAVKPTDLAFEG